MSSFAIEFQHLLSTSTGTRSRFEDLAVGASFRLPPPFGILRAVYFKTGPESYGLRPDEPQWQRDFPGDVIVTEGGER
jgi:hypothetical protein